MQVVFLSKRVNARKQMGRRKPVSGKVKAAQLKHHRAVKSAEEAGDVAPAAPRVVRHHARQQQANHSLARRYMTPEEQARYDRKEASMKIESRFLKLPKELVEHFVRVLSTRQLARPISPELAILHADADETGDGLQLTCPKRPKWSYNSSKEQVEKNEEGVFRAWLRETDEKLKGLPAPTFFERNLNVWRQLWRVTEQSDILLVLADVRYPLLHLPPSLRSYLATLKPRKPVVIVLTKTDLVPPSVSLAWQGYLESLVPESRVVLMQSYRLEAASQSNQTRFVPEAPEEARHTLIDALKESHKNLVEPPVVVKDDPEKLARWRSRVRRDVDWDTILPPRTKLSSFREIDSTGHNEQGDEEHPYLTLGLIGQPNVGKSSLLNALLRRKVVRASKTPGKTKTFQTIFLNPTLRLVDCPGLVCPSTVGFERQVLGAIIPIQHVEAVVHFVGERMPLERLLGLAQPADEFSLAENAAPWTTDELLSAYAEQQGPLSSSQMPRSPEKTHTHKS